MLYLVTDKTLYTPGEIIWFAGYLLPGGERPDSLTPDILSVALLRTGETDYAVRKNYFIGQGLCSGSLLLPDTIPPGTYQLVAGTNLLDAGRPLQYFNTVITVKSLAKPFFATNFTIDDTGHPDTMFVTAEAVLADGSRITGNGNTISTRLSHQPAKTEKLSYTGSARIGIPVAELEKSGYMLYTVTTCAKKNSYFNLQLPRRKSSRLKISFYPQGGRLSTGPQKIWWTSLGAGNQPGAVTATLLENGSFMQNIATDENGIGTFMLAPKPGSRYAVRLAGPDPANIYPLPEHMPEMPILNMATSIPPADTLSVSIRATRPATIKIAITDLKGTGPQVSDMLNVQGKRELKIPVGKLSRGLHTISLLDAQENLLAKELFFAHFERNSAVRIKTEKTSFSPREQVHVSVQLQDADSNRLGGIFTAYCVLVDRINPDRKQNIETYYYLGHWLTGGQGMYPSHLYANKTWVERQLAVTNPTQLSRNKLARPVQKATVNGKVLHADKRKIKHAMDVVVYREAALNLIKTDETGAFSPDAADLTITEGNPLWIKAMEQSGRKMQQHASDYVVEITDPMQSPMQMLAKMPVQPPWRPAGRQSAMQEVLKDPLMQITLKTVEVKGRPVILSDAAYGNKCGDFVCEGGVLNCDHNSGGKRITIPVEGRSYHIRIPRPPYLSSVVYRGCTVDNITPVYTGRKFEGMDSVRLSSPERTSSLSTLFWEPFIVNGGKGDSLFKFFTSDLPGRYKIIVEGIDTNGEVFYQGLLIDVGPANGTPPKEHAKQSSTGGR